MKLTVKTLKGEMINIEVNEEGTVNLFSSIDLGHKAKN